MLYHFESLGSTNSYLLNALDAEPNLASGTACLADQQTAGRGRGNKTWQSPDGGIYLSMLWQFPLTIASQLPSLSLAIATASKQALTELSIGTDVAFKWPNDLLRHGKKLGGLLLESVETSTKSIAVVIGLGLNFHLRVALDIDQAVTDLCDCPLPEDKNMIVTALLTHWQHCCQVFTEKGFAPWQSGWQNADYCLDKPVKIYHDNDTVITGIARGIDDTGRLMIEDNQGQQHAIHHGHLRIQP